MSDPRRRRPHRLLLIPAAAGLLLLLLPVVLLGGTVSQCGTAAPGGASAGHGGFEETAYGPPWGGIQGNGVTAYGVDLRAGRPMLEIAIDPSVLTPLAYYHVWPNPFGSRGAFLAGDTGGAIKGRHIDTYDWLGLASQNAWGVAHGVRVTKAADPGAASATGQLQAPAVPLSSVQGTCAQLVGQLPPGVYANPFGRSNSVAPLRIDMGVDYAGTGPITALGAGTVTYAKSAGTGWGPFSCSGGHGGAVVYRLARGPDRGRFIYLAEGITPTVAPGQQVATGQQLASFTGCIETGWGSGAGDGAMAAALGQACTGGDPGCRSTWCGDSMSQLIHTLGGPAGIAQGPIHGDGC